MNGFRVPDHFKGNIKNIQRSLSGTLIDKSCQSVTSSFQYFFGFFFRLDSIQRIRSFGCPPLFWRKREDAGDERGFVMFTDNARSVTVVDFAIQFRVLFAVVISLNMSSARSRESYFIFICFRFWCTVFFFVHALSRFVKVLLAGFGWKTIDVAGGDGRNGGRWHHHRTPRQQHKCMAFYLIAVIKRIFPCTKKCAHEPIKREKRTAIDDYHCHCFFFVP